MLSVCAFAGKGGCVREGVRSTPRVHRTLKFSCVILFTSEHAVEESLVVIAYVIYVSLTVHRWCLI